MCLTQWWIFVKWWWIFNLQSGVNCSFTLDIKQCFLHSYFFLYTFIIIIYKCVFAWERELCCICTCTCFKFNKLRAHLLTQLYRKCKHNKNPLCSEESVRKIKRFFFFTKQLCAFKYQQTALLANMCDYVTCVLFISLSETRVQALVNTHLLFCCIFFVCVYPNLSTVNSTLFCFFFSIL